MHIYMEQVITAKQLGKYLDFSTVSRRTMGHIMNEKRKK